MYYTTSGSYKKTKMIIDYTNIVLTVAATVIFIIVLFLRSKSGILFPIEFFLGTIVNALTSVKHFINGNKVSSYSCSCCGFTCGYDSGYSSYCSVGYIITKI